MPSNIDSSRRHVIDNSRNNRCAETNKQTSPRASSPDEDDILGEELRDSIHNLVDNISKSFILSWYTNLSRDNDDFPTNCENLIENALIKFAELCLDKLDRYKIGQKVISILHDQILAQNNPRNLQSIDKQINDHEYDICQKAVVRIFGLLATEELRKVVYTPLAVNRSPKRNNVNHKQMHYKSAFQQTKPNNQLYERNDSDESLPEFSNNSNMTTSALYTLVIAMLTKATFMPIVDIISSPQWLYAAIIWLCKREIENSSRQEVNKNDCTKQDNNCQAQFEDNNSSTCDVKKSANTLPTVVVTRSRTIRSMDLEEGIDLVTPSINFENPVSDSLKRPIDNIEIYSTEEVKSSNSCYVLYCISYDGLCIRHASGGFNLIPENANVHVIDKRATQNSAIRKSNTISSHIDETSMSQGFSYQHDYMDSSSTSSRKFYRRKMTIKRRFREFVILQLRLEENPKIRPYLKNIPKPTKLKAATQSIFALPGITNIKLDNSTIKLRQRFLERFLIALNNSPFIANSYEFKEFFSYNVNPTPVNITKSRSLILQVNLNKVFVDSFRGAIGILKATLPGDFRNLGPCPDEHDPDAWLTELQQSTMRLHVQTRTSHSKMNLERYLDSKLSILSDSPVKQNNKSASLGRHYNQATESLKTSSSILQMMQSRGGSLRAGLRSKCDLKSRNLNSSALELTTIGTQQQRQSYDHTPKTSSSALSSPVRKQRTSSNSSSLINNQQQPAESNNLRTSSAESVYFDALCDLPPSTSSSPSNDLEVDKPSIIKICDTLPIASQLINIMHFSISRHSGCTESFVNFLARYLVGRRIEQYVVKILETALTKANATFCINGITSSIWDESDETTLDVENASLDEAVNSLTKLIEQTYANRSYIPKGLFHGVISSQSRFYLSQLTSQRRNKFVIYSFFAHLLDELEGNVS